MNKQTHATDVTEAKERASMSLTASVTYDREKNRFDFDDFYKIIAEADNETANEFKGRFAEAEERLSMSIPGANAGGPQQQPGVGPGAAGAGAAAQQP